MSQCKTLINGSANDGQFIFVSVVENSITLIGSISLTFFIKIFGCFINGVTNIGREGYLGCQK